MRYFLLFYFLLAVLFVSAMGFRGEKSKRRPLEVFNDMDHQYKLRAQRDSGFFAQGQGPQRPVAGTVPMGFAVPAISVAEGGKASLDGYALGASYLETGKIGDVWGNGFPEEVTIDEDFLRLGRARYDVHCAICHGASADGNGVIKQFGFAEIVDLTPLDPATRPDGKIYDTIVHGQGNMKPYGANLNLRERWAVIAYLRVLQERRKMPLDEVRADWEAARSGSGGSDAEAPQTNSESDSDQP